MDAEKNTFNMGNEEFIDFADQFYVNCRGLLIRKNSDYSNSDNPFSNIEGCEILNVKPEIGVLIRMMDKIKRISTYVHKGRYEVNDEGVIDTLIDISNYSCILAGYITNKRKRDEW